VYIFDVAVVAVAAVAAGIVIAASINQGPSQNSDNKSRTSSNALITPGAQRRPVVLYNQEGGAHIVYKVRGTR